MLTNCPECELQVSDKALSCPHCGYPMQNIKRKVTKRSKRKRLPNGFGQITELNGKNLRNPFRVMVTVGKDEFGKPVCKLLKPISYFPSYNEAYAALVEYNKAPYELKDGMTMRELYEEWSEKYFATLKSASSARTVKSAWNYCAPLYTMNVADVRARHIKGVMEEADCSANIKSRIKSVCNLMLDYAVEYELVDRNYARTFVLSDDIVKEKEESYNGHMPFNEEEFARLWENIHVPMVELILYQSYSGWRPQELCKLEVANVNIQEGLVVGGMKTSAGTNRTVPIHPKVFDIVKKNYEQAILLGRKYLFACEDGSNLTYDKYARRFHSTMEQLGFEKGHRPHDPRCHFVTMAKKYQVDEYAIKRMVGHSITDLTERIYTKRGNAWLIEEMEKIKA